MNDSGNAEIIVSNSMGYVLQHRKIQLNTGTKLGKFNLKGNPPALYLINIKTAAGTQTEKLVIQ